MSAERTGHFSAMAGLPLLGLHGGRNFLCLALLAVSTDVADTDRVVGEFGDQRPAFLKIRHAMDRRVSRFEGFAAVDPGGSPDGPRVGEERHEVGPLVKAARLG